jgi:hypothetical protein
MWTWRTADEAAAREGQLRNGLQTSLVQCAGPIRWKIRINVIVAGFEKKIGDVLRSLCSNPLCRICSTQTAVNFLLSHIDARSRFAWIPVDLALLHSDPDPHEPYRFSSILDSDQEDIK